MSLSDGNYRISSDISDFRLAWYQGVTVKVNNSSNVLVELRQTSGGYHMRYNDHRAKSPWFGANMLSEDRVLLSDNNRVAWAIIPAEGGLFRIQVCNQDRVWQIRKDTSNGGSVQLGPPEGGANELWHIQPVVNH